MPVTCQNCGTSNPDTGLYCPSCGQLLNPINIPAKPELKATVQELGIYAGRLSRLLAQIVDFVVLFVPAKVLHSTFSPNDSVLFGISPFDLSPFLWPLEIIIYLLLLLLAQCTLLSLKGQTIGKMTAKIRIVKAATGMNGGFIPNVLVRLFLSNLLGIITLNLYHLVDGLFIFRGDRRCIHDLMAGTVVIKVEGYPQHR